MPNGGQKETGFSFLTSLAKIENRKSQIMVLLMDMQQWLAVITNFGFVEMDNDKSNDVLFYYTSTNPRLGVNNKDIIQWKMLKECVDYVWT